MSTPHQHHHYGLFTLQTDEHVGLAVTLTARSLIESGYMVAVGEYTLPCWDSKNVSDEVMYHEGAVKLVAALRKAADEIESTITNTKVEDL